MASSCPHPFLAESLFPATGGGLTDDVRIELWPSIPVLILLVWLLVTYAIFPANVTDRHYLAVSPTIGFVCISIAFISPNKGQPKKCYNEITPNDMANDARCAFMAVTLFFGAWVVILSCFFRSIALHLSVFWQIKPGPTYKYVSIGLIYLGSAALVAIALSITGAEYTFGRSTYLSPNHAVATFWAPFLAFSSAALVIQILTIAQCVILVLRPWYNYQKLKWSGYTPSANEERIIGAQQTASRIRKIIQLQWRASLVTVLITIYVCFLAAVFMQLRQFHDYPLPDRLAWFECLASSKGDKYSCLPLAIPLGPIEPELWAVVFMLVLSGLLAVAIFFRSSMIRAWMNLLKGEKRPITPVHRLSELTDPPRPESEQDEENAAPSGRITYEDLYDSNSLMKSQTVPYHHVN
ncbi:hypothetical protein N7510_002907 [Penicillium lagena]|uniref:uncharacterized protein n=1 Tax=Penicillium lagena TaxID=94218 RepID=UPI0025418585|nr:uncharacterized protein N7510_002907 [Penicillium lagena]KAJ5618923.1 hypothetical protein N7510_002907 [Penicillium lagena]